ncbi:hypothetical protein [Crocosphaera chwakensis]|uniref:Uncharacterized protein n=1 Tax=Crocosphaera chwakensis CCY0110 TaxID=391612 RepID=A3IT81_9CHRO|nr:hypothetical protein [Crocosphaera chwakensis]EAZ90266.1 hypothetical protein CY0110_04056 [Crocosphaera chwakensis CCY0110]
MSQPSNPLKSSQKRTLDAWKIALKRVDVDTFPENLKVKIEQIERDLSQNNYEVISKIREVVKENDNFNDTYQTVRQELAEQYSSKERDKIAIPLEGNNLTNRSFKNREKTKQKIDPKALFILQELDTYPLTLRDLKYRLDLPSWEVYKLIKQLWNDRKINKVSGNIWYSVFPITKPRNLDIQEDDSETYFTVTSLGKTQLRKLSNSRR